MLAFDPVSGTGNSINVCCSQLGLTVLQGAANMLFAGIKSVGIRTPESNGVNTPIKGVFLCLKKIVTDLFRALSMVARKGQLKSWPVSTKPLVAPLPGSANPLRVAAQQFASVGGGFIHAMEIVKMTTKSSAPVAPQIQPNPSHRHGDKTPQTAYQLRDAVETILGRAEAVIALVQLHLTNDATGETDQPNPELYYFSLESVTHDLKDVKALMEAFSKSRA